MAMVDLDLHEAMIVAMIRRRRYKMPAQELTDAIREDGSFIRPDNQPPPRKQIIARAKRKSFQKLFRVSGPKDARIVSLRLNKRSGKRAAKVAVR